MLKLKCTTKCSISFTYILSYSAKTASTSLFTLVILPGAVVPHLERGTVAERHCYSWATALPQLNWPLGLEVFIPFPSSSNGSPSSPTVQFVEEHKSALLSPPLVTLSSQASPLIFPSIIERKWSQTWLESRSFHSPTIKSTWFTFWPAVVFVTLGAWLLAG